MRRFFANAQNDWRGVSEILQMQNTHFQNDGVVVGDSKRTCVRKYRTSEWRTTHVTLRERIFVLRPKGLLACHSGIYFSSFLQFFLSFQRFLLSFTRFFVSYLWLSCHTYDFSCHSHENGNPFILCHSSDFSCHSRESGNPGFYYII